MRLPRFTPLLLDVDEGEAGKDKLDEDDAHRPNVPVKIPIKNVPVKISTVNVSTYKLTGRCQKCIKRLFCTLV